MPEAVLHAQGDWRYFSIPGSSSEEWDAARHGIEMREEDCGTGEVAEVAWKPGQYEFNFGASGNSFIIQAPEPPSMTFPNINILKGFHEFLKVVMDE